MKVSDKGIAELLSHEALVTAPYKDSVGVWTIGVGHTASAGRPNPQTMEKGVQVPVEDMIALFRADLVKFEDGVNKAVTAKLAQHEFDALVSFHFNTGAIGRASLVKKLNAGDRLGAAAGMLEWKKPAEIIKRRTAEMRLFRDGKYSNDGKCTIYPADKFGKVQWGSGKRVSVASLIAPIAKPVPTPAPTKPGPVLEPARNDGQFTAPKSETSLWARIINRLIGREP